MRDTMKEPRKPKMTCGRHFPMAIAILASLLIFCGSIVHAKDLKDVIRGLYGGNGFQTDPNFAGNRANDFGQEVFNSFNRLTNGIGSQTGQFAVNSTVAQYKFDVALGVPIEETKSLGPIFAERSDTIGQGRFNFLVTWSYADYKKFNGQNLSSLSEKVPPSPQPGTPPNAPGLDERLLVDLNVQVSTTFVGFFTTYGVTDNWDVNLLIPLVHNMIKAKAKATMLDANGVPCTQGGNCSGIYVIDGTYPNSPNGDPSRDSSSKEKTGLGDILFRTKYNFLKNHDILPDLGVRGDISFPTGDKDDFTGIGDFRFGGLVVASKYYSSPIGAIGPHVNAGVNLVDNQSDRNNFFYISGFDVAPLPTLALSLDVLGRHEFNDRDNSGKDIVDLAPGFKWSPYPNSLVQAAVQIPVNKNEGLRPDAVWTVGVGGTF